MAVTSTIAPPQGSAAASGPVDLPRLVRQFVDARKAASEAVKLSEDYLSILRLACPHENVIEFGYEPSSEFFEALPPFRCCTVCGFSEEGWGCGYRLLGDKNGRAVTQKPRVAHRKFQYPSNVNSATMKTTAEKPDEGDCSPAHCSPHPLLDARRDSCAWREDGDGMPHTECGEIYVFEDDWKPHVRYCQGCGGVVTLDRG